MDKVFQIFQAGTHTSMNGMVRNYAPWEMDAAAAAYASNKQLAPLVLGHPDDDFPVFGVVKQLFAKSGKLYAHADVGDELVNLVRSGHYKKVSASFLLPGHPSNPSKASLHLKHIGFLGATPPGVKGLEQFEFAEFGQSCQLPDCLPPHLV